MIEYVKNNDGYVTAFIEWMTFNEYMEVKDDGPYLVVIELFIHDTLHGYKVLKDFVRIILDKAPNAQSCSFVREYKYKGRKPRTYTRKQFEKLVEV